MNMKIAFIGAGAIAKAHLDAFRLAGAEVCGVCTRSSKGQVFATENGIPFWSSSVDEVIEKTSPQAVAVLTFPSAYKEILEKLKPFGLPLFLEKPIGFNSAAAEKLKPLLPPKVFVGQNRRFYGGVQALAESLRGASEMMVQLFLPERMKDYVGFEDAIRDDWHVLNGIHGVDLLTYLAGAPKKMLLQESWGKLDKTRLPRFQTAMYETERKNRVMYMSCMDAAGGWRLHFFRGNEEIIFAPFEETRIRRLTGIETLERTADDAAAKPGFLLQARTFLVGAQGELPPGWVNFDDALQSIRVIEFIYSNVSK